MGCEHSIRYLDMQPIVTSCMLLPGLILASRGILGIILSAKYKNLPQFSDSKDRCHPLVSNTEFVILPF